MNNRILIIDDKDLKHKALVENVAKFKWIQEQVKSYKELEKNIKDTFKQYDFEKVIIQSESGNMTFSINQYVQDRQELNLERLVEVLQGYICGDLELQDYINDHSIPIKQDIEDIIKSCYDTKKIKCIKYSVK